MFVKSIARRPLQLALLASFAAAAIAPSHAANTITATSSAKVFVPISISSAGSLAFGNIAAGTAVGTVVVTTAGTASKTGGVTLPAGGSPSAATFTITGEKGAGYTIDTTATTDLIKGTDTMPLALITDFTGTGGATTAASNVAIGTIDATSGDQVLHVGGILSVAASQVPGTYAGTVSVAVNYQ
jgi:spore coat protein U-like protein